jgi:uncharacterized protein YacL
MQPCISYCLIGAALLGSMIMSMLASKKSKNFVNFMNILDNNQQQIYKKIIKERMNIYIQGMVIGILLGVLFSYNSSFNREQRTCIFIVIALGFNYLYYSLYPKTTYMIQHLKTPEQNTAWLKIYKEMKFRCKIGLILGIVGYILLGVGWCN